MNRLNKYLILVGMIFPIISACKKVEIVKFENEPALYFHNETRVYIKTYQVDSINYSFFTKRDDCVEDVVYVIVDAMGTCFNEPREMRIEQVNTNSENAAIAGIHYEPLKNLMMPAGEVQVKIPIVLKRDPSMNTKKLCLELRVMENEWFKLGVPRFLNLKINMTAMATQPDTWGTWKHTFGVWGSKKMWFIINYVGFNDFDNPSLYNGDMEEFYRMSANIALEEYNKKMGTELMEDDGVTKVEFPKQ